MHKMLCLMLETRKNKLVSMLKNNKEIEKVIFLIFGDTAFFLRYNLYSLPIHNL